jgi:hypothetical protein
MKALLNPVRAKRRVAVDAAIIMIIILLITQMWLLTATLESYLAGHDDVALPGAIVSAVLFLSCLALYWLVIRLDRSPQPEVEPHGLGPWKIG